MGSVRLQKYLSARGIASRRNAADIIRNNRVQVNGNPVSEPSFPVDATKDIVSLDGKTIAASKPVARTIAMNKPRGYICSTSSVHGKTIYDLLPPEMNTLLPVGRLDKNSEGLLLMSNDGDLINRLTHPRFEQEKTYHVSVSGQMDASVIKKLNGRMKIEGYLIQPATVSLLKSRSDSEKHQLEFILREGRKRQIRHMCEQAGLEIHRLQRVQIKNLTLKGLKPGMWRDLTESEIA